MPIPPHWIRRTTEEPPTPGSPILPAGLSGGRHGPHLTSSDSQALAKGDFEADIATMKQPLTWKHRWATRVYERHPDIQLSIKQPGLRVTMLPRGVPEPGRQDIETTLAGMFQSKYYLALTGTSMKLKCLHWTFQFQWTDIPTKHGQPAPRCKSTCFCGQKLSPRFHLFPNVWWHAEKTPILVGTQRNYWKSSHSRTSVTQTRAVGKHLLLPPKVSWTNHHSGRSAHWAALGTSLIHWHPTGLNPQLCKKKKKDSLLWSGWAEAFFSGNKILFYYIKPGSTDTLLRAVPYRDIFKVSHVAAHILISKCSDIWDYICYNRYLRWSICCGHTCTYRHTWLLLPPQSKFCFTACNTQIYSDSLTVWEMRCH